jgi:CRP-like cAMP-binding protein
MDMDELDVSYQNNLEINNRYRFNNDRVFKRYKQNENLPYIYTLKHGIIKLSIVDESNKTITTAIAQRGMTLGLEILNGQSYMQSAKTLTPVGLCRIELSLDKIQSNTVLNQNMFKKWQEHYEHQTTAFKDFTVGPTPEKILRLLKYLAQNTFNNDDGLFYMLTLEDISSIVGVSKENCSRALVKIKTNNLEYIDKQKNIYKFK